MLFRERKQMVIFVAAGAAAVAFMLFRYLPLRQRLKVVEQAKAAQALVISRASMEKEQMPVLIERLLTLQQVVGNYQARIPAETDLGVFLQQIADLMSRHNLREQVIVPHKEIAVKELKCIPVDMQCKGKLAQVFEFYKRMQKLDRLVRIESVKLLNDKDFSGEVSMQSKVVIYYRSQPERG